MGFDISIVVEFSDDFQSAFVDAISYWNLCRNRDLFGSMGAWGSENAVFSARGMPKRISEMTLDLYSLCIAERDELIEESMFPCIEKNKALKLIESGEAHYIDGYEDRISSPDCVYATWLTREELIKCTESKFVNTETINPDFWLLIEHIASLEKYHPSVRAVIWFER
jgi:hypothetical protein